MSAKIDGLLSVSSAYRDTFEIVRDQIGAILAVESENQMLLASSVNGLDPTRYELRVYLERYAPWDMFREDDTAGGPLPYQAPVVNVCFEGDQIEKPSTELRSARNAMFYIDCYGFGIAQDATVGHLAGDEVARREVARAASLVRKILNAGPWLNLGLPGVVGQFSFVERKTFTPDHDPRSFHVAAMRLALNVHFFEFSRENSYPNLESIMLSVNRTEDGKLYFQAFLDVT